MELTRRSFCAAVGGLALLPACRGVPHLPEEIPDADPPAELSVTGHGVGSGRVVEARWSAAVDTRGRVDAARAGQLLEAALIELLGSDPYASFDAARRRVSIKVNTITSQAYSHPELAAALARGLVAAGSAPERVTIWDRDTFGLRDRGYRVDPTAAGGFRCLGTDEAPPATPRPVLVADRKVFLSPLLLESDLLFNVAALKDHSMAGVSLTLKNNFGMIHDAEPLHGDVRRGAACEPGISELAAHPELRGRTGLCIIDALVGVCEGGPGPAEPAHVFRHAGILISLDPVALDRRGLLIIEARRARLGLPPLAARTRPNPSPPIHIDNARARGVSPG